MTPPQKLAAVVFAAACFVVGITFTASPRHASAAPAPPVKKPDHKVKDFVGRADQKRDRQNLYSFESGAYKITTDVDKDLANDIAAHMDEVFKEYDNSFARARFRPNPWAAVKPGERMSLYVLRHYKDYVEFLKGFGVNGLNSGGVFFRTPEKLSGLATWVEGQSRLKMYYVLQHEGFHQFADARIMFGLPPWVNEGVADYFGEAVMVDGKLVTGRLDRERLERMRRAVKAGETLPFRELMTMNNDAWIKRVNAGDKSAALMYDSAWSICYYLIHGGKNGRAKQTTVRGAQVDALEAYLRILNDDFVRDPNRDNRPAAFKEVFSNNLANFEKSWKEGLQELKPDPWLSAVRHVQILAAAMKALQAKHVAIDKVQKVEDRLPRDKFHDFPVPAAAELIPDDDAKCPPDLLVTNVAPNIRLDWSINPAGEVEEEITFEPPPKRPKKPAAAPTTTKTTTAASPAKDPHGDDLAPGRISK